VAVLLTAASWVLQRLPGQVLEEHRAELVRTLRQSRNLIIEVECSPAPLVPVRDGQRLLIEIRRMARGKRAPEPTRTKPFWPALAEHAQCRKGTTSPLPSYTEDELRGWVEPVRALAEQAEQVHVLMNNCYRDYAVRNARQLAALLAQPRAESVPVTPPAPSQ
jgi:uncharacterized protein YecE (DUF72 family)